MSDQDHPYTSEVLRELAGSIPESLVNIDVKVPGLYPSLTVRQWNAAVDVLTAEELSANPNHAALAVRDAVRDYLRGNGYRRLDVA